MSLTVWRSFLSARVLVVCTANICRSPVIASLLAARLGPGVRIESRGARARDGVPMCPASSTWSMAHGADLGADLGAHRSQRLELADVKAATIILTAAREHRTAVLELRPSAQVRTFTLAQAARIATWVRSQGLAPPEGDVSERLLWLTEELDASRGSAPRPPSDRDDDLPDPHHGADHAVVHQRILSAVDAVSAALG